MTAEVIAIGPFSDSIADCLSYDRGLYSGTRPGAVVLTRLFQCNSTDYSLTLAECFGIDPWDFNQHVLTASPVNPDLLTAAFGPEELSRFDRLRDAGFAFYFAPNG